MTNPSKAFRRLGMVGAAAVVGLVPVALSGGVASAVTGATLSLASTAATASTTATNTFTTDNSSSTNQLVIASNASSGTAETLPACISNGAATNAACTNYTVTFGSSATNDPVLVAGTTVSSGAGNTATLALATPIPTGSSVTVTISGVVNGSNGAVVYFTDTDNTVNSASPPVVTSHGTPQNTNTVTLTAATPVATPGVSSINPTAFSTTAGEPFTIIGTNFAPVASSTTGTGTTEPVVCFVPAGSTAPAPGTPSGPSAAGPCTGTGDVAVGAASGSISAVTTTEIQGNSPTLVQGNYNVVVYNYDANLGTGTPPAGGYTAASGTSSQTLVSATPGLNFVPESGVRVIDSRSGQNLPKGTMTTGAPVGIPLTHFAQSLSSPTNLPGGYTGLDVNVTAVAPASGGNLQVWTANACANGIGTNGVATEPATVNFQPPQDTNNSQLIPVNGTSLCIQDNGAAVSVVVDVVGYTTGSYLTPAGFTPAVSKTRILDTRPATQSGSLLGPLQSNTVYSVSTGLPAGALVALNVADVAPSAPGNLRAFPEPAGGPPAASGVPNAAVDNYIVNTDASAMLIMKTGNGGNIDLYSAMNGAGTVNAVIDLLGGFSTGTSVNPVAQPYRIYDSRPGPIPAAGTVTVVGAPSGSGANFTPSAAVGVIGNLSDINPVGQGYLVTFPAGGVVPGTASEANFPLQTRNTNNVVALNPSNGSFSIYAGGAATNTTYDVSSYIGSTNASVVVP